MSLSSRRPSRMSDMDSHLTILRPRESVRSDNLSDFGAVMAMDSDKDPWQRKSRFVGRIVSFCLGPGNIWRFPRQAFIFGNATYVYLYIVYMWIFGTAFLAFELGLGQYFSCGFAKVFLVCPIMEGITFSMVIYCLVAGMLYSLVNVYSFLYLFSSFSDQMVHSYCGSYLASQGCVENSRNFTNSSSYMYFFYQVVNGSDSADYEKSLNFNWKNAGILFFICVSICLIMFFAVIRMRWAPLALSVTILSTLLLTFILTLTVEGVGMGLKKFFVPTKNDINDLQTWVYPVEQVIVTLGTGAGPLTTFWSVSKVKLWTYTECFVMNVVIFVCTMVAGMIFFGAAGAVAHARNVTIDDYFYFSYNESQAHIIVTQLFNEMTFGLGHFAVFVFYSLLVISCTFTLLEYTYIILLYLNSFEIFRRLSRTKIIVIVCLIFLMLGMIGVTEFGFGLMMALDKIFIGPSLICIVTYEMICFVYFYGMRDLSDDIEFVLGIFPNYYFQITWYCLPSLLFIFLIGSLYLKSQEIDGIYDLVAIFLLVFLVIMPVIAIAAYKSVVAIRKKKFRSIIWPREIRSNMTVSQEAVPSRSRRV